MREIGGYLQLEQFAGREYYPNLIAVNCARNALLYVLRAKKIRKLYLPSFLCDAVTNLCSREGYTYEYYHIGCDFLPEFEGKLGIDEYLYVVNYYGQISNEMIQEYKSKFGNVIFDNAQAFFQEPVPGIDTIYSCRKFFGVPDGGYVATDSKLNEQISVDVSKDRMRHILGRFEGENASDYYGSFRENEHGFMTLGLRAMSRLTHNLLRAIDYEAVKRKRQDNFAVLADGLGALNPLPLIAPVGPYVYPFYCKDGMEAKKFLARKKIFVSTLWPNVLEQGNAFEKDYAENILPLPCDQRYSEDDMLKVVQEVRAYVF